MHIKRRSMQLTKAKKADREIHPAETARWFEVGVPGPDPVGGSGVVLGGISAAGRLRQAEMAT